MKSKSIAAFVATVVLLLATGLAACGNGDSGEEVSTESTASGVSGDSSGGGVSSGNADSASPSAPTPMAEQLDFEVITDELPEGETDIEGVVAIAVQNADHVTLDVKYPTSPPAGGPHSSFWQNCGFYTEPLRDEHAVHSLEHGAVWVTYTDAATSEELDYLKRFAEQNSHILVSPYSRQDTTFVLSAWGRQLVLNSTSDPRFVRFMDRYLKDGPTAPEPGAVCFGGIGVAPDQPLALTV